MATKHEFHSCIITCNTTCNDNFEIVNGMSTDQLLLAFWFHCVIYGALSQIFRDNAKIFFKGDEEINNLFQVIEDQKVQDHFAQKRVEMMHIPAKSLHWGRHGQATYRCSLDVNHEISSSRSHRLPEMQTLINQRGSSSRQ